MEMRITHHHFSWPYYKVVGLFSQSIAKQIRIGDWSQISSAVRLVNSDAIRIGSPTILS